MEEDSAGFRVASPCSIGFFVFVEKLSWGGAEVDSVGQVLWCVAGTPQKGKCARINSTSKTARLFGGGPFKASLLILASLVSARTWQVAYGRGLGSSLTKTLPVPADPDTAKFQTDLLLFTVLPSVCYNPLIPERQKAKRFPAWLRGLNPKP